MIRIGSLFLFLLFALGAALGARDLFHEKDWAGCVMWLFSSPFSVIFLSDALGWWGE